MPGQQIPPTLGLASLGAVRMNLTCLRSSDPAAANASLLFDFNNDHQNLWRGCLRRVPGPDPGGWRW
ncbi:uncharacterized protein AKAME5_002030400 [Lates japonicus]|uniref:Uncharacterized protein n=1 Tax=Lates japonicus TaxID=270547 RepID=A0AAD3NCW1_LATJO|nr:uncharacterized protein AKAME5_002030400 [Lates japonicus]